MKNKSEGQLWDMFSKFIRARDANWHGYCCCISCSTVKHWKELQAGHFIAVGRDRALKYNEMNVNAQCSGCNNYQSGNLLEYRKRLIIKYGVKAVEALELAHEFKTTKKKLNQLEINALFDFYKKKFMEIEKEKCL